MVRTFPHCQDSGGYRIRIEIIYQDESTNSSPHTITISSYSLGVGRFFLYNPLRTFLTRTMTSTHPMFPPKKSIEKGVGVSGAGTVIKQRTLQRVAPTDRNASFVHASFVIMLKKTGKEKET